MNKNELKYYGLHACSAIWKHRPQDIIRVYLDEPNLKILSPMLKWCAAQKRAYRIVPSSELELISDSIHHEGVCILARERSSPAFEELKLGNCILYLDGVQNPHNLGSILRTCAHFGLRTVLGERGKLPALSPSCCRIAQGGAELIELCPLLKPLETLRKLKNKGFTLIGTSSHEATSLYQTKLPVRSILLIGAESTGIDRAFQALADWTVQIPGSNRIESLNVSVAAALCVGEYFRQHS